LIFLVDDWAGAVFHVLAHVRASAALPASLFDAAYVAAAAAVLGPASARSLGEDASLLGRLAVTHDALARVQLVAWLFRSPARARAVAARDLADLPDDAVDAPRLLPLLAGDPGAEILRAAAELELPLVAALPPLAVDRAALATAVEALVPVAPRLARSRVGVARALGYRGRVMDDEIWIGDAPVAHAAWQAAHEATVAEVAAEGVREHAALEGEAVERLARRALAAGMEDARAAWWSFYAPRSGT
jgi:hypothetical protein